MNTAIATATRYEPQSNRLGLFHRATASTLLAVLMVYMSVFVSQIDPKIGIFTTAVCVYIGGRRLLCPCVWPLIAIVCYNAALAIFFPGPKPDIGIVVEHPLFLLDCVLLSALVLGGQSVQRQYALLLGILFISLIGAVGDTMGHDMTALLPFELPDDAVVNTIILQQGDVARIRGFFTEGGVLGAVSIGVATMIAMGAVVLIRSKACLRFAWMGLISSLCMGGAILCITVTKSGFVMVIAGCVGFVTVLLCSRNPRCRMLAIILFASLIIGGAVFLAVGPYTITNYLRGEVIAAANPYAMTSDDIAGHSGVVTRYKCWLLAFHSLRQYPLGVGPYGLGAVIQREGNAGLTHEMRYFFSRDNFGLKNALANLIAEDGVVGISLLAFWVAVAFLRPILHYLREGSLDSTLVAGIYGASALSSLVFLFSCELYPSMAFLLVLKCHADAIAQATQSKREPDPNALTVELIG
jgi:hypothetical protein